MNEIEPVSGGCPATKSACLCLHEKGHEGPHACNCGGSWKDDGTIVTLPKSGWPDLDALGDALLALRDQR